MLVSVSGCQAVLMLMINSHENKPIKTVHDVSM